MCEMIETMLRWTYDQSMFCDEKMINEIFELTDWWDDDRSLICSILILLSVVDELVIEWIYLQYQVDIRLSLVIIYHFCLWIDWWSIETIEFRKRKHFDEVNFHFELNVSLRRWTISIQKESKSNEIINGERETKLKVSWW